VQDSGSTAKPAGVIMPAQRSNARALLLSAQWLFLRRGEKQCIYQHQGLACQSIHNRCFFTAWLRENQIPTALYKIGYISCLSWWYSSTRPPSGEEGKRFADFHRFLAFIYPVR
jgi:hypothetical protein